MEEMITLFCLGNGDIGCDGCQREKDWQTLNQLPDPLRLAIQGQAVRPWHVSVTRPVEIERWKPKT